MNTKIKKYPKPYLTIRTDLKAGKVASCTLKQKGKNGKPNKYWCCNESGYCWPVWSSGSLE